jgi:hypothetical protein
MALIKLRGVQQTALFGVLTAVLLKNKAHWNAMLHHWVSSARVSKYCSLGTTYSRTQRNIREHLKSYRQYIVGGSHGNLEFCSVFCGFWHIFFGLTAPQWARASSITRFPDHARRRTTVGRTPLDKWSARRRDLYLTNSTVTIAPRWDSNPQSQQTSGRTPTP